MFCVTGDVHGPVDARKLSTVNWPQQRDLTRNDYLIVCGDMGIVWDGGKEDNWWQAWFNSKPFTTLFVDGNHENHVMLGQYPVEIWNGGKIHRIQPNVIHLMRGQVYNIDGIKFFAMGGASSRDKSMRTEGIDWWTEEMPSNEEYEEACKNLEENEWKVDIVISHCAADSIQAAIQPYYEHDKLTNFFEAVVLEKLQYKLWYFGHYHYDKMIDDKHFALYETICEVHN